MPTAKFLVEDICTIDSLNLNDSSTGATQWDWNFGDNTSSTLKNPKHKYSQAGKYIITLVVSNSNGCKDSVSHNILVDSTCVWPGDANNDKTVDNSDILKIGIAYNDTGFFKS